MKVKDLLCFDPETEVTLSVMDINGANDEERFFSVDIIEIVKENSSPPMLTIVADVESNLKRVKRERCEECKKSFPAKELEKITAGRKLCLRCLNYELNI